jgi:hypothetical protein
MIDLLVSLAIVSILIALMFPAISLVRESTRRVICASNLRQTGLGISMYTQDFKDRLPDSVFLPTVSRSTFASNASYERLDTVLLSAEEFPGNRDQRWDGLGLLFGEEYIAAPNTYYCPSHRGNYTFEESGRDWANTKRSDEIIVNYLFRGSGPEGQRTLYNIDSNAALVTDTLRSFEDLNHVDGFNIMQAGLAVTWYEDIAQDILLRTGGNDASNTVRNTWGRLDRTSEHND